MTESCNLCDNELTNIHGVINTLVLICFKPGAFTRLHKPSLAHAGGLHEASWPFVLSVETIVFSKTQLRCVCFVEDLHEVLHFSCNSSDKIVDVIAQADVKNTITHRIYQPNRSCIDSSFLKVFNGRTPKWKLVKPFYHASLVKKCGVDLLQKIQDLDKDPSHDNIQESFGYAAINFDKDDLTAMTKPALKVGNTPKVVKETIIISKMVKAVYRKGRHFVDDNQTETFAVP
jgi:hypothetical protein